MAGGFRQIQDIGSALGDFGRQRTARRQSLGDEQRQRQGKLQDAIALMQAKSQIEAQQSDPVADFLQRGKLIETAQLIQSEGGQVPPDLINFLLGGQQQPQQAPQQTQIPITQQNGRQFGQLASEQQTLFNTTGKKSVQQPRTGGISSERTIGINVKGKEVLIPTIIDGVQLTNEEAIQHFLKTGENFGVFNTVEEAEAAAEQRVRMLDRASGGTGKFNTSNQEDILRTIKEQRGDSDLIPKKFGTTLRGERTVTEVENLNVERQKKKVAEAAKAAGKQTQSTLKTQQALTRIKGASQELVARAKQAVDEQGGFGIVPSARGAFGAFRARLGIEDLPPEKQFSGRGAFAGQLTEMTLALSPILTGQNRVIRGIVNMLKKTLPNLNESEAQFVGKLKQTNKNAYRLALGLARSGLGQKEIERLNDTTPDEITSIIQDIISDASFTPEDEANFEEFWLDIVQTQATKAEGLPEEKAQTKTQGQPIQIKSIRRK